MAVVSQGLGPSAEDFLGSGVDVGDRTYTLGAVMSPDFAFPSDPVQVWIPTAPTGTAT